MLQPFFCFDFQVCFPRQLTNHLFSGSLADITHPTSGAWETSSIWYLERTCFHNSHSISSQIWFWRIESFKRLPAGTRIVSNKRPVSTQRDSSMSTPMNSRRFTMRPRFDMPYCLIVGDRTRSHTMTCQSQMQSKSASQKVGTNSKAPWSGYSRWSGVRLERYMLYRQEKQCRTQRSN